MTELLVIKSLWWQQITLWNIAYTMSISVWECLWFV